MKRLIVNPKNYTSFEYSPYLERDNPVETPENPTFVVGQVVYVKSQNSIGVILGCIDEDFDGDVRTDCDGMQSIDDIEFATKETFNIPKVRYVDRLRAEVNGATIKKSSKSPIKR